MMKTMLLHLLSAPASLRMLALLSVSLAACTPHDDARKVASSASASTPAGAATAPSADARFVALARGRVDVLVKTLQADGESVTRPFEI